MPIDFQANYARMLNEKLLDLVREADDLTPEAYDALWTEIRKRGLESDATRAYQEHHQQLQATQPSLAKLTTIARFENITEAHLARMRLESAGFPCFLADEQTARLTWPSIAGWIKLQVRQEDAESARMLLESNGDD